LGTVIVDFLLAITGFERRWSVILCSPPIVVGVVLAARGVPLLFFLIPVLNKLLLTAVLIRAAGTRFGGFIISGRNMLGPLEHCVGSALSSALCSSWREAVGSEIEKSDEERSERR